MHLLSIKSSFAINPFFQRSFSHFYFRGSKYVYGFFYYLPWKLPNRLDNTRKFCPNEVIQTKFYDILPLHNIKAHCYVVDEKSYCEGRPRDYTGEKDIFICEYELDRNLKELKRIARRR